jgi:hypothetical protein
MDEQQKHPVLFHDKQRYKIMMDGVAFEFTLPPTTSAMEMYNNIKAGLDRLREYASAFGYEVVIKPTVHYDFERFYSEETVLQYQCGIFGCDPDLDAVMGDNYDSPEIDARIHPYRYGGGHFHMSDYNVLIKSAPIPMVKFMAICQGNYSIANSKYGELEKLRAWKYGQPARYRIQHYSGEQVGVEYRSPSNHWIESSDTIEGMFYWAERAYKYLTERNIGVIEEFMRPTMDAIANADAGLSQKILDALPN